MSNETYSLVLNSSNASNRTNNGSLSSVSYNINWDSILPRKYNQYSLNWQLKSSTTQTIQFAGTITTANTLQLTTTKSNAGVSLYVGLQFLSTSSQLVTITAVVIPNVTYTVSAGAGNDVTNTAATTFYSINNQFLNNLGCSINFGKMMCNDQSNSQSNLIGFVYPSITPISSNISSYSYYASTLDNGNIMLNYPANQNITVNFTLPDLVTAPTQFSNYVLQLYFTPIIISDQDKTSNTTLLAGHLILK